VTYPAPKYSTVYSTPHQTDGNKNKEIRHNTDSYAWARHRPVNRGAYRLYHDGNYEPS